MDRCGLRRVGGVAAWACMLVCGLDAAAQVDVLEPLVVARVGEVPIMRATLDAAFAAGGFDRLGSEELKVRARADLLTQLVEEQLLRQLVAREGQKATEAEIDAVMVQVRPTVAGGRAGSGAETALPDEKALRERVALDIAIKKLLGPQITRERIDAAAAEHRRELDGTLVRVSHIVLRPDAAPEADAEARMMQKAASIRSQVLQGAMSFADAARRHSAGPSRRRGGDLGFLPRSGVVVDEFARRVFSASKGEVTQPFLTPIGVHLAVVTDIRPGGVPEEKLRPQFEQIAARRLAREILARERANTSIVYGPGVAHSEKNPDRPDEPARLVVEPLPVGR